MLANEKSKGMGEHEEGMDLADEFNVEGKVQYIIIPVLYNIMAISTPFGKLSRDVEALAG